MSQSQESFDALKGKLTIAPVSAYADFSLPFILEVDASHKGLGAVLLLEQEEKVRPIPYVRNSPMLTEHNTSNYNSMRLVFSALVVGHDREISGVLVRAQVYCVYR